MPREEFVSAMLLYNLGVALIFGAAGLQSHPAGIALWPAVILHAVLGHLVSCGPAAESLKVTMAGRPFLYRPLVQ